MWHFLFLQHKVLSSSIETKSVLQGYIHKPSLAMSCSACLLYAARTAQTFLPSQAHILFYNICVLFWQGRWEQGRSMSNTCCSFASPTLRLFCPFISFSTGQHLDEGLKYFSSEQNVLAKNQTSGFTHQVIISSSQPNALQYSWSSEF